MPQRKNSSKRPTSTKNTNPTKVGKSWKYLNTNLKSEYNFSDAKPVYNHKSSWRIPQFYKDEVVFLFLAYTVLLFGSLILFSLYYNRHIDNLQQQINSLRSETLTAPADNSDANCVLHFCHVGDGRIGT